MYEIKSNLEFLYYFEFNVGKAQDVSTNHARSWIYREINRDALSIDPFLYVRVKDYTERI